jgi:hypothetical protein
LIFLDEIRIIFFMKRVLAIFLVSILSFNLLTGTSFASTPKVGSACTKLGTTVISGGLKYICNRSGIKLVWNRGVAASKTSGQSTSSPQPTKIPTGTQPTPSQSTATSAIGSAGKVVITGKDFGSCAAWVPGGSAFAILQIKVNGNWINASAPINWIKKDGCSPDPSVNYYPSTSVNIDEGMAYRWQMGGGKVNAGAGGLSPEIVFSRYGVHMGNPEDPNYLNCSKNDLLLDPLPVGNAQGSNLWARSGWTKPATSDSVIASAKTRFATYVSKVRFPETTIANYLDTGVDSSIGDYITKEQTFEGKTFCAPPISGSYINVVSKSADFTLKTYSKTGFGGDIFDSAQSRANAFPGVTGNGAPGTTSWNANNAFSANWSTRGNGSDNRIAGHEYFHGIQLKLIGGRYGDLIHQGNGSDALFAQWILEGGAEFVGAMVGDSTGVLDYATARAATGVGRFNNSPAFTRSSPLSAIFTNGGDSDPYGIGWIATEFLVSEIGMPHYLQIYRDFSDGRSMSDAFKSAAGVSLEDFYSMFEEIRGTLGVPRT